MPVFVIPGNHDSEVSSARKCSYSLFAIAVVARGKLLRGFIQGVAADAERVMREFDTARYLARAVAAVDELVPRPDVAVLTGDLVDHGVPEAAAKFSPDHLRSRNGDIMIIVQLSDPHIATGSSIGCWQRKVVQVRR